MGNFSSQETDTVIKSFNSAVSKAITNISNNANLQCSSSQMFSLHTGSSFPPCGFSCENCNFVINQTSQSTCDLTQSSLNSVSNTFTTELQTQISNWVDEQVNQSAGWLATGLNGNFAGISTTEEIKNQLNSLFSTTIANSCSEELKNIQLQIVNLCGDLNGSNLNFSQNSFQAGVTVCVARNITNNYSKNTILQQFVNDTDQAVSQQAAGIGQIVYWIIAAIVIVSVISLFIYLYFGGTNPQQVQQSQQEYYAAQFQMTG